MSISDEPKTIGLSKINKSYIQEFKDNNYFSELTDAYKFAIGYALKKEIDPPKSLRSETIFAVGNLDNNKELYNLVLSLNPDVQRPVYKYIEDLANWGAEELYRIYKENNELDIISLIE